MAFLTAEQAAAARELQNSYGRADFVRVEHTDEPYGLAWIRWGERNLFVKPDGSRLSWRGVSH